MRNEKRVGFACVTALLCLSGSAMGVILDIEATAHGDDWALLNQEFISQFSTSPEPHFGMDTLNLVEETLTDVPWFDLWITVTREQTTSRTNELIAIDKKVYNRTNYLWTDFHMEIGLPDVGRAVDGAPPLNYVQDMDFLHSPEAVEELGKFKNPPTYGEDIVRNGVPHDNVLWWFAGQDQTGKEFPGVVGGDCAQFWMGLMVPADLFEPVAGAGIETAQFVLRQHWSPTPGATTLLCLGGAFSLRRRR